MQHLYAILGLLAALVFCAPDLPARQGDPLANARRRWEALAPGERVRIQERWQRYQSLSEEERRELERRAQRVKGLRERAERALPAALREHVQQLPEQKRERILSELALNESVRVGARMRAALPPEVVQRLEQARPEDRARYFANYQLQQRKRVTSYMLEHLGARLRLSKDEVERLKQQPEAQRAACVLELRQRLTQAETREHGLPPGLAPEEWERWLKLPPEEFFERLADHVRERQLAGAEAGIGRGGSRPVRVPAQGLAHVRALLRLQEAAQADPADLVELAEETPEVRRERVDERTRQRCLRILREDELVEGEELERWQRMNGAAFAGAVHELLAPLRASWRPPAEEKH